MTLKNKNDRKASGEPVVTAPKRTGGSSTCDHSLHHAARAHATPKSKPKSAKSGVTVPQANSAKNKRSVNEASAEPASTGPAPKRARSGHQKPEQEIIACPFYKHNPRKHQCCVRGAMKENTDMRRHLERYHLQALHCPRCKEQFGPAYKEKRGGRVPNVEGIERRDGHIKQRNCKVKAAPFPDGITEDQLKAINDVDKKPGSKERSWFETWDILFPGERRPSTHLLTPDSLVEDFANKFLWNLSQLESETPRCPKDIIKMFLSSVRGDQPTYETSTPTPGPMITRSIPEASMNTMGSMIVEPNALGHMFDGALPLELDFSQVHASFPANPDFDPMLALGSFSPDGQFDDNAPCFTSLSLSN